MKTVPIRCGAVVAFALLLVTGVPTPAQSQNERENLIHVELIELRNDKGQVLCALFSSADGFPAKFKNAMARTTSGISGRRAVCEFRSIAPGTYAVAAVHDENSNSKLDTNFIGWPREGVGVSNDARGRFGPPAFDAAAFPFPGGRLDLQISIIYY